MTRSPYPLQGPPRARKEQSGRRSRFVRLVVVAAVAGIGVLLGGGIASAHVTVNPNTATAGSYSVLTFRVPNESATAKTVGLTVSFPIDHPFASVSVAKQPGWTTTMQKTTLKTPITNDDGLKITEAVSSITWKADASAQLSLGEFAEFDVSVGPVPDDVASISFNAVQNYSDGTVVNWNEPTPASGAEPDHPSPTVKIVAAEATSGASASGSGQSGATVTVTATPAAAAASSSGSDGTARLLGVIGIVVAAFALLAAAVAIRRRAS